MDVKPVKILVCGDVRGALSSLATKVTKINSMHGPFAMILCVGQFFASARSHTEDQPLPPFPIPLYFVAGAETNTALIDSMPNGGQLGHNIHYLGRSGITAIAGLTVAYLSGVYDSERYFDCNDSERVRQYEGHYIEDDVLTLKKQAFNTKIDILLTCEWGKNWLSLLPPSSVPQSLQSQSEALSMIGSPVIGKLASQLLIRYHFAANQDCYFELPPYTNHHYYTRFFALGSHSSVSGRKEKSLYACNVALSSTIDYSAVPAECTACPYTVTSNGAKRPFSDDGSQPNKMMRMAPAGFVRAGQIGGLNDPAGPPNVNDSHNLTANRWDMTPMTRSQLNPPRPGYTCHICNEGGHWIEDCPRRLPRNTNEPLDELVPPANFVCKICNVPGHWLKHCPSKDGNASNVPINYICKKCGGTDHFIKDCPLVRSEQSQRPVPPDYRCKKCDGHHWIRQCPVILVEEEERAKRRATLSDPVEGGVESETGCWLCLATTDSQHLILSIGDSVYMALPKGGLTSQHCLLMPVDHLVSQLKFSDHHVSELERYKQSLRDYYQSQSRHCVFFERNIPTRAGQHCHLHCVPLKKKYSDTVQSLIESEAEAMEFSFEMLAESQSLQSLLGDNTDQSYLFWELPNDVRLVHRVVKGKIPGLFDFQRTVLAKLIGKPERADWKQCRLTVEGESELADAFKDKFKPFDFTLNGTDNGDSEGSGSDS